MHIIYLRIKIFYTFDTSTLKLYTMLKTQIDSYDMVLSVENHFDDDPTLWRDNQPVTETIGALSNKVNLLSEQIAIQIANPTGITQAKEILRKELEESAVVIGAGTNAYAYITNNPELKERTHMAKSVLARYRDAELTNVCINLLTDCREHRADLEPYGVTDELLDKFEQKLNSFQAIMKNPTDAIGKRKAATEKIPGMLTDISDLLKNRMDNLMTAFESFAPEFVAIYFNVRKINSTGSRHLSLTISTIDAATQKPIANAKLEVVGKDIKRVSSKRGYNKVANLSEGVYQLNVSNPLYRPVTVPFTVVSGETTQLVVQLELL
jgi:hypothetical protein